MYDLKVCAFSWLQSAPAASAPRASWSRMRPEYLKEPPALSFNLT